MTTAALWLIVLMIINVVLWVTMWQALHRLRVLQRFYSHLIRDVNRQAHIQAAPPDTDED